MYVNKFLPLFILFFGFTVTVLTSCNKNNTNDLKIQYTQNESRTVTTVTAKKEAKEVVLTVSQARIKESFADSPEKMSDYMRAINIVNKLNTPKGKVNKEDIDHLINCYDINTLNPAAVISLQLNNKQKQKDYEKTVYNYLGVPGCHHDDGAIRYLL